MKRTFSLASAFILTFALGASIGVWIVTVMMNNTAREKDDARAASEVSALVGVLNTVHRKHPENTIDLLEIQLDYALFELQDYAQIPSGKRDPRVIASLRIARAYRADHPHTSGRPEADAVVAKVLSLSGPLEK